MVDMIAVESRNIEAVGYDETTETLVVQFIKSGTYEYRGVPQHLFESLLEADSVGKFFNANVKDLFPFDKIG